MLLCLEEQCGFPDLHINPHRSLWEEKIEIKPPLDSGWKLSLATCGYTNTKALSRNSINSLDARMKRFQVVDF
jgi:hypothetical protein